MTLILHQSHTRRRLGLQRSLSNYARGHPTHIHGMAKSGGLRIGGTIIHSLAFIATALRATHQWKRSKWDWDDTWAIIAVSWDAVLFICLWIRVHLHQIALRRPIPAGSARTVYLITSLAFTSTLWAARISIACSIMRLLPFGSTRTAVMYMIGLFGLLWSLLVIQYGWICGTNHSWILDCPLGVAFGIQKLAIDAVGNILLVATPIHMLWHSTLPKTPRRMIRVIFATSITTTAIGIIQAVYSTGLNPRVQGYTAHFEAAISVMICNLLVIVTWCYRVLQRGRDMDEELSQYLSTQFPVTLTDVSLTDVPPGSYHHTISPSRLGGSVPTSHYTPHTTATDNQTSPSDVRRHSAKK